MAAAGRQALVVLLCLALGAPAPARGGDARAGRVKAAACSGCHGLDGNSTNPRWPKLAGQHGAYLVKALQAYRSGVRRDASMRGVARGLSDADIDDLAAWYASQVQE